MSVPEEKQLLTKTQLKEQRLKPGPGQVPATQYWSNRAKAWFDLYNPAEAVPMREYRAPSEKQAEALTRGRYLAATIECSGCKERFGKWDLNRQGMCCPCAMAAELAEAASETKAWLEADPLFLDVETTGLSDSAEVIEIAILDKYGTAILDTLVRPIGTIEPDAIAVHGITHDMVVSAPLFTDIAQQTADMIKGRTVIAHNADFDSRLIYQGIRKAGIELPQVDWRCTMRLMTTINDGRWPTLRVAMDMAGASMEGKAHRAKTDAEGCRRIVVAMGGP